MNEQTPIPCKACGISIIFIRNPKTGKMMPVDHASQFRWSAKDGTIVVDSGRIVCLPRLGEYCYTPHWATCTSPNAFRKREMRIAGEDVEVDDL